MEQLDTLLARWSEFDLDDTAAVFHVSSQSPLPAYAHAGQFERSAKVAVQTVLEALEEFGMVQQAEDQNRLVS